VYHCPKLNRRLDELQLELHLRHADFIHKTLKPCKNANDSQSAKELIEKELTLQTAALALAINPINLPVLPEPAGPFFGRSNVLRACVLVLIARMRNKVLARESLEKTIKEEEWSNWESTLNLAESVLRQVKESTKLADNQSSHATLFLAFLFAFRKGAKSAEATSTMLQYLDETFTHTQHQKDDKIVICFCCGKQMESSNQCSKCKTVNYCSFNCQSYDALSFQQGGLWYKQAHSKICALVNPFTEFQKRLKEKQSAALGCQR
jgi:hypothetical protein